MLIPFADQFFIINLPDRSDRRREMRASLGAIGATLDGGPVELFAAIRPVEAGGFQSIGARGCFESQLAVLRLARERGLTSVGIFEDDLDFAADYGARAPQIKAALDREDWHFFYGGHELPEHTTGREQGLVRLAPTLEVITAHFVCIREPALSLLVDYLETMRARAPGDPAGGPMHVDGAYSWFRRHHPEFSTFAAVPPLGHQRASRSDITPRFWYNRTPVLREAVNAVRRLRAR